MEYFKLYLACEVFPIVITSECASVEHAQHQGIVTLTFIFYINDVFSTRYSHLASPGLAAVWRKKRLKLLQKPDTLQLRREFATLRGNKPRERPRSIDIKQLGKFLPKEVPALSFCYFFIKKKVRRPSG
ncbi:hypothetical protein ABIB40_002070 [Pedobacter sp. UYP30]